MVILTYESGPKRVELQQGTIQLPTSTYKVISPGTINQLKNVATKYAILVWDGNDLRSLTPSNAWKAAFNQFRVKVQQETGEVVPEFALGKTSIRGGKVV